MRSDLPRVCLGAGLRGSGLHLCKVSLLWCVDEKEREVRVELCRVRLDALDDAAC